MTRGFPRKVSFICCFKNMRSNWWTKRSDDIKFRTMKVVNKKLTYNSPSLNSPILPTHHGLDTRAELTCSFSLYYGSKQWMFCRFVLTPTEQYRTICLSCTKKTSYEGKYEVWSCISSREFFSSSRIVTLPMLFTISLHSFSQWIILPTNSVHWASFLIDTVNGIFYPFSSEFRR